MPASAVAMDMAQLIEQTADMAALVLQAFIPKLLGRAHVTAYVTGNIAVGAAADLARRVQSLLSDQLKTQPPFPSQVLVPSISARRLESRADCVYRYRMCH